MHINSAYLMQKLVVILGFFELLFCTCCLSFNQPRASSPKAVRMKYSFAMRIDAAGLEKCLYREYASFFSPMEKEYYSQDVVFVDPLTSFTGIDKYKNNVDMLAGKTPLGALLFKDASINLHNIERLSDGKVQTRWTLRVTAKLLPWQPTARFTGVSIYTLDDAGRVSRQEDYWDSINLVSGSYKAVGFLDGLGDFLDQLKNDGGADMAAPELPYELLRRAKRYEVRRYPETTVAETLYDQRPEGYDRLGSFAGGSNEKSAKLQFFSPTLMTVNDADGKRSKVMSWPLAFAPPGGTAPEPSSIPSPTISKVNIKNMPSAVFAVSRFEIAATEPVVRGYTKQLLQDLSMDGLVASETAKLGNQYIVGQYDALFSLNKRRVEVWVKLESHPWTTTISNRQSRDA